MKPKHIHIHDERLEKPDIAPPYKNKNTYSRLAKKFLKTQKPSTAAVNTILKYRNTSRAVYKNVNGSGGKKCLVSNDSIKATQPIIEMIGHITLMKESPKRKPGGSPFIFTYEEFVGKSAHLIREIQTASDVLSIQTERNGNDSKFIRRSCTPNCELTHMMDHRNNLSIFIVATMDIALGEELTLPFESDLGYSKEVLECANPHPSRYCCIDDLLRELHQTVCELARDVDRLKEQEERREELRRELLGKRRISERIRLRNQNIV